MTPYTPPHKPPSRGPYRTGKFVTALSRLGTLRPDAPLGVLDIGSNSVRLVGYSGSARTPLPIYNERAFCRLGEAVSARGRIEGEPYDLAIMTLHRFRAIAERLGIGNLVAFATAAVRDATNRASFIAEAEAILGHKIKVLSGEEEAAYSADGVMLAIPGADGIVADLGGGSLELARVYQNKTHEWATLPLGVLALQQASMNDHQVMGEMIAKSLSGLDWLAQGRALPLYVVGGTWRNLAKVHMYHQQYALGVLHHYATATAQMRDFAKTMSNMGNMNDLSDDEASLLTASSSNRRAALPIAALVLDHLIAATDPGSVIVSANAVREGVLYSMLEKKYRKLDPLLLACEEMAERLCKAAPYGHELAQWTCHLFKHAAADFVDARQLNRLRQAGCLIGDLAWASHPNFRAAAVSQAVLTAPFSGIDHPGRVFLARALAYRHEVKDVVKNETRDTQSDFGRLDLSPNDDRLARALGLSMRLAHSLSASLPGALPLMRLKAGRTRLRLKIDPSHAKLRGPIIDKRLRALADMLGLKAEIKIAKVDAPDAPVSDGPDDDLDEFDAPVSA